MSKRKNPTEPMFKVDETLVAIVEETPYEAVVMSITDEKGKKKYKLHFPGWSRRHDKKFEVGTEEGRMFKTTLAEYVKEHRSELSAEFLEEYDKKKEKPAEKKEEVPPAVNVIEPPKPDTTVKLTKKLIQILLFDKDQTDKCFVCKLPAKYPTDQIVADYLATIMPDATPEVIDAMVKTQSSANIKCADAQKICTVRGMLDYFNTVTGHHLLYKFERPRYNDMVEMKTGIRDFKYGSIATLFNHGVRASSEYGFIYLLRLIVKLPELMLSIKVDPVLVGMVAKGLVEIIAFLDANHEKYFEGEIEYEAVSPDYYRRATETFRTGN
uniref:MRG domain-containing protein n=1 Tax=Caenorhabditis tropicalis TaxID=1561998 RepID=A0A1I7TLL8_9PELO